MIDSEAIEKIKCAADTATYDEDKLQIQGYAVQFPLKFLEKENLKKMKHFEFGLFMLPNHLFT